MTFVLCWTSIFNPESEEQPQTQHGWRTPHPSRDPGSSSRYSLSQPSFLLMEPGPRNQTLRVWNKHLHEFLWVFRFKRKAPQTVSRHKRPRSPCHTLLGSQAAQPSGASPGRRGPPGSGLPWPVTGRTCSELPSVGRTAQLFFLSLNELDLAGKEGGGRKEEAKIAHLSAEGSGALLPGTHEQGRGLEWNLCQVRGAWRVALDGSYRQACLPRVRDGPVGRDPNRSKQHRPFPPRPAVPSFVYLQKTWLTCLWGVCTTRP